MEAEKIPAIRARFFREAILWSLSQIVNFISHIFLPFSIWVPFSHNIFHYWKVSFESVRGWPSAVKVLVTRCNKPNNGSQLKKPDISGAMFTLSLSVLILNSQCVEGTKYARVLLLAPITWWKLEFHSMLINWIILEEKGAPPLELYKNLYGQN